MKINRFARNNLCSLKNFYLIIVIIMSSMFISNAQHSIGITGGYCLGTFTNFSKKQNYDASYHFKNGAAFSFFYENEINSIINLKIELQYKLQYADMKINNIAGHASFYRDIDYAFHLLNLNFILPFRLVEKKSFKLNFLLGLNLAYTINASAKGNGWEFYSATQIDTNGNPVPILTTQNWEKDEHNSKDLSIINVGIDLGLEFVIPISYKTDFLIQNRYTIFLTNISALKALRYTSIFTGNINIGFRFKLDKM